MYIGERFVKDGKTYEVTSVFGTNFGFKEVEAVKTDIPVFKDEEPEPKEVKEEPKEAPVRRGRKKKV